jgi:hypothetical protein
MTDTDWHASPNLLARFLNAPDTIDAMAAASIEAHLVMCQQCRRQLTRAADPVMAAISWDGIADRIDRPRATLLERVLGRFGISSGLARLLVATPSLQAAGLAVIALVAAAAALVSRTTGAEGPFLVLAPLVPLGAVAAAFAPPSDPSGEAGLTTPLHGAGLIVRRTIAILGVTFGLLGTAALALPELGVSAAAWALPALALSIGALALGTWLRIEVAVSVLAAGWLATVGAVWWAVGSAGPVVDSATFATTGQTAAIAVALIAAVTVGARRDRFALVGPVR